MHTTSVSVTTNSLRLRFHFGKVVYLVIWIRGVQWLIIVFNPITNNVIYI